MPELESPKAADKVGLEELLLGLGVLVPVLVQTFVNAAVGEPDLPAGSCRSMQSMEEGGGGGGKYR